MKAQKSSSQYRRVREALGAYPRLTIGGALLVALAVMSVGAPLFSPTSPLQQNLDSVLSPPSAEFLLGTDQLGRDVLSRLIYGGQLVLAVGLASTTLALVIGVLLGLLSGYRGGWVDSVIMRIMDGIIVFPDLILALAITYALGPSFWTVSVAIGIVNIPKFARVVRGQVLGLKEREFISAAKVSGASTPRVMSRHLLPNVLEVIVVQAAVSGGTAIFTAASLSFLGLGIPPPTPDWGGMLRDGFPHLGALPLLSLAPGMLVFLAMLSFNLIGDGLRDLFDPKAAPRRKRRRTPPPGAEPPGTESSAPPTTPPQPVEADTPDGHPLKPRPRLNSSVVDRSAESRPEEMQEEYR